MLEKINNKNKLLKLIELQLRSDYKTFTLDIWEQLSELDDWDYRIIQAFIIEVKLAIQKNDMNFVHKRYTFEQPIKNKIKYDLLIACLRRDQHDLIMTDVINRLVIPTDITYELFYTWEMGVEQARNLVCEKALELGCKKLLFIDDDIVAENTALVKLWETMENTGRHVVAANYQKKADYEISAHGELVDYIYDGFDKDITEWYIENQDYLKETDLCAMGFTLIDIDWVSKCIPYPYFWTFAAPDGYWSMGEDAFFTKNLFIKMGNTPIVDLRPSILHYDKTWKRMFGKRDKSVTYATNSIATFDEFNNIRIPPNFPIINIAMPKRTEQSPEATDFNKLLLSRGYRSEHTRIYNQDVDDARNILASQAVQLSSEFMFFVDDDIILPQNSLVKMIELMEEDEDQKIGMITGDYLLKGKIPHSAHLQLNKDGVVTEFNRIKYKENIIDSNWFVGLGCALIRTSVFRQLKPPFFKCYSRNNDGDGGVNEDSFFSEQLLENGYSIKIIRDICSIHVDFKNGKMYGYDLKFNPHKYACSQLVINLEYISINDIYNKEQ